jgi:6-phosphogluconolactonase (cycloisomerase 2 family)
LSPFEHSSIGETLYTLAELSNMLTSHILPPLPDQPVALDVATTLSDPPNNPTDLDPPPLSAEILSGTVSAAYPTPYLYVTNRNDPSPEGDILSIFEMGDGGSIKLVKEVRTGLNHLRGIAFDEEGRYLIAGGTFGGGVKMFERVDGGKDLKEITHLRDVEKPTGFYWLSTA